MRAILNEVCWKTMRRGGSNGLQEAEAHVECLPRRFAQQHTQSETVASPTEERESAQDEDVYGLCFLTGRMEECINTKSARQQGMV